MTWFKVCDSFAAHRKVEALQGMPAPTFTAAITIWTLMGSDCGLNLTDGVFSRVRARKVTGLPDKLLDVGLAALVTVGLFDRAGDECAFHDWPSMQPTRAQVEAQRAAKAAAGRSGGLASGEARSKQVLPENEAGASRSTKQTASTVLSSAEAIRARLPTRPVPTRRKKSDPSANGADAPPAAGADKGPSGAAKPVDPEPMPFSIAVALSTLAEASDGRFTEPRDGELHPRHLGPLTKLIRAIPNLDAWARVGRWLAAGALRNKPDLTVAWLLVSDAHTAARGWEESGAPNLGRNPAMSGDFPSLPGLDAERAAFNAEIERRKAAYHAQTPQEHSR